MPYIIQHGDCPTPLDILQKRCIFILVVPPFSWPNVSCTPWQRPTFLSTPLLSLLVWNMSIGWVQHSTERNHGIAFFFCEHQSLVKVCIFSPNEQVGWCLLSCVARGVGHARAYGICVSTYIEIKDNRNSWIINLVLSSIWFGQEDQLKLELGKHYGLQMLQQK